MIAPTMHRIDVKIDYFFLPYRIVWDNWKDFITGGDKGEDLPSFPRMALTDFFGDTFLQKGSLADYMGIPPYSGSGADGNEHIGLLWFRAYQLIWNEYFRDQNLQDDLEIPLGDGSQTTSQLTI